ncbi:tyrosine-type recombinase/integrase [Methanolobus sp. WCC4]|uniref:tyrosine-type recombinase/integrase n=1 Tax=Methanolobus sp. WCC4 TaxID=3125784 RepID=UPI0030FD048A
MVVESQKDNNLPEEAQKKAKRKQLERYVHPTPAQLENVLDYFFKNKRPPSRSAWNENLLRWAERADLDPLGMSSKTTRKSIESWMITADIPLNVICLRQGHDSLTSMMHYQSLPFTVLCPFLSINKFPIQIVF